MIQSGKEEFLVGKQLFDPMPFLGNFKTGRAVFRNDGQFAALGKVSQEFFPDVDKRSNDAQSFSVTS